MNSYSVTVVDGRSARPRTLARIVQKPRDHATQQGPEHRLVWLIEAWQHAELASALGSPGLGPREDLVISDTPNDRLGMIRRLLGDISSRLAPGARVAVISFDPDVTQLAQNWCGTIVVRGLFGAEFLSQFGFIPFGRFSQPHVPPAIEPELAEAVLAELVAFLGRNGVTSREHSIHRTDIIPAVRIKMPHLKQMQTTGLATAATRMGVQRGLLETTDGDIWLLKSAPPGTDRATSFFPNRR